MARYYRNYKKLSDYKWAIALVTFLSIVLIALSVVTKGFTNWDTTTWFSTTTIECEHEFEDGKCILCEALEEPADDSLEDCEHVFEDGKCTLCEALEVPAGDKENE